MSSVILQHFRIASVSGNNYNLPYILISGNIPGAKKSLVIIKSAVKNSRKVSPKEILSYEEKVTEEPEEVETPTMENAPETEEESK